MPLFRRPAKDVKNLRQSAEDLWQDQQAVLAKANDVLAQLSQLATDYTKAEVAPRVKVYADRVAPVAAGVRDTVIPAAAGIVGAATTLAEEAGKRAPDLIDRAQHLGQTAAETGKSARAAASAAAAKVGAAAAKAGVGTSKAPVVVAVKPKSSGPGTGSIVGLVLGLVALGGVAFAVVQTLRADDDLWVADDEPDTPASS